MTGSRPRWGWLHTGRNVGFSSPKGRRDVATPHPGPARPTRPQPRRGTRRPRRPRARVGSVWSTTASTSTPTSTASSSWTTSPRSSRTSTTSAELTGIGGTLACSFANDPNGRKALLDDGLFLEYAVFTPEQLASLTLAGVPVVSSRDGFDASTLLTTEPPPTTPRQDTVEFHLNEALTNLFVGLHRELRGEHLTAMRFIQVYPVDHVLALVRLTSETALAQPDPVRPDPPGRAVRGTIAPCRSTRWSEVWPIAPSPPPRSSTG